MNIHESASVESILNTFKWFLRRRRIMNPRRATLTVWAEYNAPKVPDTTLDEVWRQL